MRVLQAENKWAFYKIIDDWLTQTPVLLGSNNFYASRAHTHIHTHTCTHIRAHTTLKSNATRNSAAVTTRLPEDEAESEVYLADAAASIACDFCVCASVCSYVVQSLNICSTNEIFRAQGTVLLLLLLLVLVMVTVAIVAACGFHMLRILPTHTTHILHCCSLKYIIEPSYCELPFHFFHFSGQLWLVL